MTWNAEFHYPKDYCLSNNIISKIQTYNTTTKNSYSNESKRQEIKPTEVAKLFKQVCKKEKKRKNTMKSGIRMNKPQLILLILLKSIKRRKKTAFIMSIKSHAIAATRRAIMQISA